MDAAMPVMILAAESVGKTGYESVAELDADKALFQRIEKIRRIAGEKMGLGDVSQKVVPKVILLARPRSEEHTSELQSLMRISYAVFCLKKKNTEQRHTQY